jgi:hypothetical protein
MITSVVRVHFVPRWMLPDDVLNSKVIWYRVAVEVMLHSFRIFLWHNGSYVVSMVFVK